MQDDPAPHHVTRRDTNRLFKAAAGRSSYTLIGCIVLLIHVKSSIAGRVAAMMKSQRAIAIGLHVKTCKLLHPEFIHERLTRYVIYLRWFSNK